MRQTCAADRSEESSEWRHPRDLAALAAEAEDRLELALEKGWAVTNVHVDVGALAWSLLDDDPDAVVGAVLDAVGGGAAPEQVGRAARLRRRAAHRALPHPERLRRLELGAPRLHRRQRAAPVAACGARRPELLRGAIHGALRVYLDRFLNVPAARLPVVDGRRRWTDLAACWDVQGEVDRAGSIAYGFVRGGGSTRPS